MIHRIRRFVVKSLMRAETVIIFHITPNGLTWLLGRGKFVDIDQLRFQASEPSLDYDVICPAGLPVHALADMQLLQKLLVLAVGKLAALVGVEDGGYTETVHGVAYRIQDGGCTPRVSERFQPTIFLLYQSMMAVRYMWLRWSLM